MSYIYNYIASNEIHFARNKQKLVLNDNDLATLTTRECPFSNILPQWNCT